MKALVTGASGFIGVRLCEFLAERGTAVRAAVRNSTAASMVGTIEQVLVPDILDRDAWRSALHGVDVVIHLAARVHVMNDVGSASAEQYRRVNVDGTRALLEECADARVTKFVYFSTVKVNGERTVDRPFRADDRPDPQDPYSRSKFEAERIVSDVCERAEICWTTIRPPLVYGPGVGANFARLVRLVRSGFPLPLAACNNRRSMVFVDNVCDLIAHVLVDDRACSRILMVADDEAMSVSELIRAIARADRRPERLVYIPRSLLAGIASLCGKGAQVDRLTQSLEVDAADTGRLLDWRPPYTVSEALKRTLHD